VTDWNKKDLVQGHTDIPLNKEGKIQAKEAAQKLKQIKFDKIFSSDLLRASQTAEIIAEEHNLIVETTAVLRERNFGYLEGDSNEKLREIRRLIERMEESKRFSYKHHPTMESDEEVMSRFLIFLREIAISNPGKTILVVCHGGLLRALLFQLGIIPYAGIIIKNLAHVKLESDGVEFFVKETFGIEKT
jgi:broad specificity phosphatase PhoE